MATARPQCSANQESPGFSHGECQFWLNENEPLEPVHVHVAKGKPTPNATKVWITRSGVRLENNNSKIPRNELKEILNFINENKDTVIVEWATRFGRTDFKEK